MYLRFLLEVSAAQQEGDLNTPIQPMDLIFKI